MLLPAYKIEKKILNNKNIYLININIFLKTVIVWHWKKWCIVIVVVLVCCISSKLELFFEVGLLLPKFLPRGLGMKELIRRSSTDPIFLLPSNHHGHRHYFMRLHNGVFSLKTTISNHSPTLENFSWLGLLSREPTFITSRIFTHGFCN